MRRILFVSMVLAGALGVAACSGAGQGGAAGGSSTTYQTDFPLPASVSNFTESADGAVNFQTSLGLGECLDFYREALTGAGLTERTITTSVTDTTFSIVFDGDPNGRALVVQGVDLGNGSTNINIRYEDV